METRETITLDARAQQRLLVLTHVLAGELDVGDAAAYPRLSTRQVTRLCERLRTAGLVLGLRIDRAWRGERGRGPWRGVGSWQHPVRRCWRRVRRLTVGPPGGQRTRGEGRVGWTNHLGGVAGGGDRP